MPWILSASVKEYKVNWNPGWKQPMRLRQRQRRTAAELMAAEYAADLKLIRVL